MKSNLRNYVLIFVLLLICAVPYSVNPTKATTIIANDSDVKILLLLDHEYGGNYIFIREILEDQFGWNVTTVALEATVSPCTFHSIYLDVDVTVDNLTQLSSYDCLSIMPGAQVDNLLASQDVMNLINSAVSNGLVVSGWCRAVRVLAAADVIDGKNVTGNADYEDEYVAAGATFFELSPPIIDGKLVTSVRSRFYRMETCLALAEAIGCYESNNPIHISTDVTSSATGYIVSSNVTDDSGLLSVQAKLVEIDENGERILGGITYTINLLDPDENGVYEKDIPVDTGRFTLDIIATDIYMNGITFSDLAVLDPSTLDVSLPIFIVTLPLILYVTIQRMRKKKK
ncbi:MAG: DJ-1/PfpI family protein [Candidatus Heimdallarchaeota archaeon]